MKIEFKRWLKRGTFSLTVLITVMIFWTCGFESLTINYVQDSVKAGEYAEFHLKTNIATNEDNYSDKLIVAVQVPKLWNPREAGNIIIEYEDIRMDQGKMKEMEIIPVGTSPVHQPGISWEQHLLTRFNERDPNILDDMQWVAFISKEQITISNTNRDFNIYVKAKTSSDNLRAKIGFCLYHEKDGGADIGINPGNDYNHYAVGWGDCFEVTDGEGDIIDFCDLHFNQHTPGMANQNDILTLRYIGDIADNDLLGFEEIYIVMVGTTTDGKKYEIKEKTEKTKLMKESTWGLTYGKTFWPEGYFNLPKGEVLDKIEYYFTNKDGNKYVSLYDDQYKNAPEENPTWTEKPLIPFIYAFQK